MAWMVAYLGFITLLGASVTEPLSAILFAKNGYWYLYAMVLFFVIARLLRNQPAWVVVAVALIPNIARPLTDQFFEGLVPGALPSMAMNLGFFLIGAYFKDLLGTVAARATLAHTAVLGLVAVIGGIVWLNTPSTIGQTYLYMSLIWVAFGISLAVQITRNGAPAWAGCVGARTLPIYVAVARAVRGRRVPPGLCGVPPSVPRLLFPCCSPRGWPAARWSCTAGLR